MVYVEVVKPERLVYDHVSGPRFQVTVTFSERRQQTRLHMQMLFESANRTR
ncbi:MAG: SRPBCC domain-containing protein [Pyrinomonadaceae bacterium]